MSTQNLFIPSDDSSKWGHELKAWLRQDIRRQWQEYLDGASAFHCVQKISTHRGQALATLFSRVQKQANYKQKLALVALGGLGREELFPHSDVDLLLLTDENPHQALSQLLDGILYPLWDSGLEVGHALRTASEFIELANIDKTVCTSILDCRFLAGDPKFYKTFHLKLAHSLSAREFQMRISNLISQWMAGAETSTVYRLEPNIKTDPGGLRTMHEIWWAAKIAWGAERWSCKISETKISQHDLSAITTAREFLYSVRLALHALCSRRQDVLRFDLQDEIAQHLKIDTLQPNRAPGDILLEHYYRHAKLLKAVATRIQERCAQAIYERWRDDKNSPVTEHIEGFKCTNGLLSFKEPTSISSDPIELLRILRVAQKRQARVSPEDRMLMAEKVPLLFTSKIAESSTAVRLFIDILTDPCGQAATLEALHELGLLERLLPEFASVIGLVQRDLYHTYTVDAHLIYCAQTVGRAFSSSALSADIPSDIVEATSRVSRPHVLVLGALMHDVGKGRGQGHSARGAFMAEKAARRMLWRREDRIDLAFLVQEHLSMMIISQRRNLEDLDLVRRFARRVETFERLDMLFILTYADAVTTGPEAFSDWKASLLRNLYQRTRRALKSGAGHPGLAKRAAVRIKEITNRLAGSNQRLLRLANQFTHRHLVTHRFDLLQRHFHSLEEAQESGVSVSIRFEETSERWEIIVSCADHAGLLSDLTGVLAARGISVGGAYTDTTLNGYAICTFETSALKDSLLANENKRGQICSQLKEKALRQGGDYAPEIKKRRRRARHSTSRVPVSQTRVVYDSEATDTSTVMDVFTPDRVGVLHLIARAIFDEGVLIEQARITTEGERAVDSFYIVEAITKEPLQEESRRRLASTITQVCTKALQELDIPA